MQPIALEKNGLDYEENLQQISLFAKLSLWEY